MRHSGERSEHSLNVTVAPVHHLSYLTIWPTGEGQPMVSTLNSPDGRTKANAAIVPAKVTPSGSVSVYVTDTEPTSSSTSMGTSPRRAHRPCSSIRWRRAGWWIRAAAMGRWVGLACRRRWNGTSPC